VIRRDLCPVNQWLSHYGNIVTSAKCQSQSGPVQAKKIGAIGANVPPAWRRFTQLILRATEP